MATGRRVQRLRDMVDRIERLPASPDRDRLLSEVRSRAVDVDTGVKPRAMLPMREPAPVLPGPAKRDRGEVITRVEPPKPAPVASLARPNSAASPAKRPERWPVLDDCLSLEDTPLPDVRVSGNRAVPPWTLGLRG